MREREERERERERERGREIKNMNYMHTLFILPGPELKCTLRLDSQT